MRNWTRSVMPSMTNELRILTPVTTGGYHFKRTAQSHGIRVIGSRGRISQFNPFACPDTALIGMSAAVHFGTVVSGFSHPPGRIHAGQHDLTVFRLFKDRFFQELPVHEIQLIGGAGFIKNEELCIM